jgi:Putative zinc-finger
MNPCARNRKLIAWLALDALAAREASDLRAHLATCAGCRQYLEEMSHVTATLAAAETTPQIHASEAFHRRVTDALRAEESRPAWEALVKLLQGTLLNWRVALPVAGALAVVIMVLSVPSRHPGAPLPAPAPVQVASAPNLKSELAPTIANYQIVANRSLEELDDLLTRQSNRSQPRMPIYTASAIALINAPD